MIRLLFSIFAPAVIGGFLVSAAGPATAQSIQEAIAAALTDKPSLQAQKWQTISRLKTLEARRASYLPAVSAQSSLAVRTADTDVTEPQTSYPHTWFGVTATLPLFDSGSAASTTEMAEHDLQIAELNLALETQETIRATAHTYMNLYTSELIVGLNLSNLERLEEQLRATQARKSAGVATRADVSQAVASVASARAQLAQSEGERAAALSLFMEQTGLKGDVLTPFTLRDDLLPVSQSDAIKIALEGHIRLKIADLEYRKLRANAVNLVSEFGPNLSLSASATWGNTTVADDDNVLQSSQSVSLNFTTSLYTPGLFAVEEAARAATFRSQATLAQSRNAIESAVIQAWVALESARAQTAALEEQVTAQQVATGGVEEEVRLGQKASIDAIEARFAELDARNKLALARRNEINAMVSLVHAIGRLTPEGLGL